MPRKEYSADLRAVIDSNNPPQGISAVQRGDDDGFVDFTFAPPSGGSFSVTAIVSDVSHYPESHNYVLLVDDAAPRDLTDCLIRASAGSGQSIQRLLDSVSSIYFKDDDESIADAEDSEMTDDEDDGAFGGDGYVLEYYPDEDPSQHFNPPVLSNSSLSLDDRNRIRQDLQLVKKAGFKVGASPHILLGDQAYLSISCQIKRLGISEEAMQAWGISPEEHFILLIKYPHGYKPMKGVEPTNVPSRESVEFCTGIGSSYKPSIKDICNAFSSTSSKGQSNHTATTFRKHFISESMRHLLNDTFLALFKCRLAGASWDGATLFYHDHHGVGHHTNIDIMDSKYRSEVAPSSAFPQLVTADHVKDHGSRLDLSFPLVAMQFAVRKFVRSPDYCLNCHRRMPEGLEALKPYVCDIPLCLFQYMQMGLGPRIEHEITTQPRVVDLLVTLCYCSAKTASLDSSHLPKGLGLRIPPVEVLKHGQVSNLSRGEDGVLQMTDSEKPRDFPAPIESMSVQVNLDHLDMTFPTATSKNALSIKKGDWVAFKIKTKVGILHAKIEDVSHYPRVQITSPLVMPLSASQSVLKPDEALQVSLPSGFHEAVAWLYTTDCDTLDDSSMREVVWLLLELLPTIDEMRQSIKQSGSDLRSLSDRIPTPVLGLLRWIIASNRACIMQIDLPKDAGAVVDGGRQEAVHGMDGWMQFKFAMGAPDKERRFVDSVQSIKAKIPTLFAWHGSALQNWHSIIRDGLNYTRIVNGRAYGNGIYFAREATTSIGYSGNVIVGHNTALWPLSKTKPSIILSLSEIVNAPSQFIASKPYYVVQHLDWTQTRYLFVQGLQNDNTAQKVEVPIPTFATPQDPNVTPLGSSNKPLVIPASKTSRNANHAVSMGHKRFKAAGSSNDPIFIDDSASSVATDDEDRALLELEEETVQISTTSKPKMTDFVPGTLDRSKLPTMAPPTGEAASAMATKCLQRDYNDTLKEQKKQPLHELGWYIDPEIMMETGNLYQWIVELHSFDSSIPLAEDMKLHDVQSVVLEMRFGKEYPMAPPFIRVIRPRFLAFLNGGGGHVTAGGALCMELLTNDGWNAGTTMEAILLQVRLAISSTDPKPARLDYGGGRGEYGVGEAVEAYIRACHSHGWTIPAGFRAMARGMGYQIR